MRLKNTWFKSLRKQLSLNIATKIDNYSVSQCLLHCLKQTELKYDEALVYSSGLNKHGTFLMWKITKMTKISPFFFSQKFCITPLINSLLQNVTVWCWVYSQPDFVCYDVSGCHSIGFKFLIPQFQEYKNSCLNP